MSAIVRAIKEDRVACTGENSSNPVMENMVGINQFPFMIPSNRNIEQMPLWEWCLLPLWIKHSHSGSYIIPVMLRVHAPF